MDGNGFEILVIAAEAELASLKLPVENNQRILERLKSGNVEGWTELEEVLAEGASVEGLVTRMESQLKVQLKEIADAEQELERLRLLCRGRRMSAPGNA